MLYWWPRLLGRVPMPRTLIIGLDDGDVDAIFACESDPARCRRVLEAISDLIDERVAAVGGYPVFIRTDYTSCKLHPLRPYRVRSRSELPGKLYTLIVDCHEAIPRRILLPPRPSAVAVCPVIWG